MATFLRHTSFHCTIDQAFNQVIRQCSIQKRKDQDGTWIHADIEAAYIRLFELGHAHSIECWNGNQLVGGLYGVRVNQVFCGESMFSVEPNASKMALINLPGLLQPHELKLIDCQVYTPHLESLGACMIPRKKFIAYLRQNDNNR